VVVVDALKIEAELVVGGGEIIGEVEGEPVLLGGMGVDGAEDVEGEGVPGAVVAATPHRTVAAALDSIADRAVT
jgi:hypothetical protein